MEVVTKIIAIESVDLVFDPATTTNLFETRRMIEEEKPMEPKDITLESLKASHPDIVKAVKEEAAREAKDSDESKKARESLEKAQKRVTELEAVQKASEMKAVAEKLLKESKMPEASKTVAVRKRLEESKDEETAKTILKDVEEAVASATRPVSEIRKTTGAEGEVDLKETVRVVRASR